MNILRACPSLYLKHLSLNITFLIFRIKLRSDVLTLVAYFKEFRFSAKSDAQGLRHVIINVLELPPKESFSSLVTLLSLYGTWRTYNGNQKMQQGKVEGSRAAI